MPGALKAREIDGGNTMETTRIVVDKNVVVAGEVEVLNGGKNGESSKEKRKRRKKRRKLSPPDVEQRLDFDEPLDRVRFRYSRD